MAKLNKQVYYNSKGEKKLNCYHVIVPKEIVGQTNIKETDELEVRAENNKLIVEKKEG